MVLHLKQSVMPALVDGQMQHYISGGWSTSLNFLMLHRKHLSSSYLMAIIAITLEAVDMARQHGIHMLTFPPHCTHKMLPLDCTYFRSLKAAYNTAVDSWMTSNPRRRVTVFEMAHLFGQAFLRTATAEKAVNGSRSCGLWPYDPNVFDDADFAASAVTEEEDPSQIQVASSTVMQAEQSSVSEDNPVPIVSNFEKHISTYIQNQLQLLT